jgi:hypothetical protein
MLLSYTRRGPPGGYPTDVLGLRNYNLPHAIFHVPLPRHPNNPLYSTSMSNTTFISCFVLRTGQHTTHYELHYVSHCCTGLQQPSLLSDTQVLPSFGTL